MKEIRIFTDGSAVNRKGLKNSFKGGVGVFFDTDPPRYISKGYYPMKSGRAEVIAFYFAIKNLPLVPVRVKLYSDSEYVINSINKKWVYGWEMRGFKYAKNGDVWKKVLSELRKRPMMDLNIFHIKGHQKDLNSELIFGNNVADLLANYKRHKTFEDGENI